MSAAEQGQPSSPEQLQDAYRSVWRTRMRCSMACMPTSNRYFCLDNTQKKFTVETKQQRKTGSQYLTVRRYSGSWLRTLDNDLRARTASLRSSSNVDEATRSHSFWIWKGTYNTRDKPARRGGRGDSRHTGTARESRSLPAEPAARGPERHRAPPGPVTGSGGKAAPAGAVAAPPALPQPGRVPRSPCRLPRAAGRRWGRP